MDVITAGTAVMNAAEAITEMRSDACRTLESLAHEDPLRAAAPLLATAAAAAKIVEVSLRLGSYGDADDADRHSDLAQEVLNLLGTLNHRLGVIADNAAINADPRIREINHLAMHGVRLQRTVRVGLGAIMDLRGAMLAEGRAKRGADEW